MIVFSDSLKEVVRVGLVSFETSLVKIARSLVPKSFHQRLEVSKRAAVTKRIGRGRASFKRKIVSVPAYINSEAGLTCVLRIYTLLVVFEFEDNLGGVFDIVHLVVAVVKPDHHVRDLIIMAAVNPVLNGRRMLLTFK